MEYVIVQIECSGATAYEQLKGYLITNNERYITRRGNALDYVKRLDKKQLYQYLNKMK